MESQKLKNQVSFGPAEPLYRKMQIVKVLGVGVGVESEHTAAVSYQDCNTPKITYSQHVNRITYKACFIVKQ
jgi:hypothetical protein